MTNGSRLDKAVEKYVILLDTCFAMQESFDKFLQKYKPLLQRNRLLVPYKVVQELNRIVQRRDDREQLAADTLSLLDSATKEGIAELRRDPQDDQVINDAVISRVVEGILPRKDVLVLTHDNNLTAYLQTKTQQQSYQVKDLIVAGLNDHGELFAWPQHRHLNANGQRRSNQEPQRPMRRRAAVVAAGPVPFRLTSTLAPSLGTPLPTRMPVRRGDSLFLKDGSRITLRGELASGGEGTIYELDDQSSLCKVYHQNKLTRDRQEKIELMLTRAVNDLTICWPRAAVYDLDKVFRGFIMPRAPGKPVPLGHSLFIPNAFLKSHPSWTRLESVRLAEAILKKIQYLHDMNVLIGDINPLNILMKDEQTVYFVDCDSYQVEGYPCPVGTVNFTAPEIQGSDFRSFLRTQEHELFAVATLLFMIFMPGKSPYSHQGGEDGVANIRKMHFPYPLGERRAEAAPEGPWRMCWSHLPHAMKKAFNQCFHEDHRNEKRVSVESWMLLLNQYRLYLEKHDMVFHGPVQQVGFDLSILPENMRRIEKNGQVQPPWPHDGLTDRDRMVRRLVSDAQNRNYPAPSPYGAGQGACGGPGATVRGGRTTTTVTQQPSRVTPPPTRRPARRRKLSTTPTHSSGSVGGSADWKWIVGILITLVLTGIVGVVWYYWDPIIEFLKTVLVIATVIAIVIAIGRLFVKK